MEYDPPMQEEINDAYIFVHIPKEVKKKKKKNIEVLVIIGQLLALYYDVLPICFQFAQSKNHSKNY